MTHKCVIAICPGNSVTGGPELIHQLVDSINQNGGDAKVLYYPFERDFKVPNAYSKYNVKVCNIADVQNENYQFVIPEIATQYTNCLPGSNFHIWWLSVDNHFKYLKDDFFGKCKLFIKRIIKHKSLPLDFNQLGNYKHWVQSYYAKEFLKSKNIESNFLSDFLNEEHLNQSIDIKNKKDIICFNPKKGVRITEQLINTYPRYKFVPIQKMTAREVSELLKNSKIYIDFGNHPGKDRIPREAAMAGCVVITGVKGSAKNKYDIAVGSTYKIDENSAGFCFIVGELFKDVFDRFEVHSKMFEPYRDKISSEKLAFDQQVLAFMDSIKS